MTRETFIHSQVYSQDITTYIYQKIVSLYYLGTIICTYVNILYFNFGYKYDSQIQIVAIFRRKKKHF